MYAMPIDRRDIMKGAALGAALLASNGASAAADGQIVHHVFFWLKHPASSVDRGALIAGIRGLDKIGVVRGLQVGVPASTERRKMVESSFHVSQLMLFDDLVDQKTYQGHPLYKDFVAKCAHLWAKTIVYDMVAV
jgi:stress responsive alpha/beta barrel protein